MTNRPNDRKSTLSVSPHWTRAERMTKFRECLRTFTAPRLSTGLAALALAWGMSTPAQTQALRPDGAPPVNLSVDGLEQVLMGHVFVTRLSAPEPGATEGAHVRVHVFTHAHRVISCDGYSGTTGAPRIQWSTRFHDPQRDHYIPVIAQVVKPDTLPTLSAIHYDARAGQTVLFMRDMTGRWSPRETGHLQERLPAAVYRLCPDFPSPEDLGLEVNAEQTVLTYPALVTQHPGTRVLRPDLVTQGAIEVTQ